MDYIINNMISATKIINFVNKYYSICRESDCSLLQNSVKC